ncbi:MAG: hypothetical protein A2Y71_13260 [Bacteroidetes bacterium RBG_13_42_15]|nr:MAG: hypothetical protein A2Y71_13260 [Bacteroidetes bacterium RBG_13_42_15]
MRKRLKYLFLLLILFSRVLISQETPQPEVYLITCGPGTEIYSVYGHSALRIVVPEKKIDTVYNWGVFDFATPNFAWKFAKGRLIYSLGVYSFEAFLKDYFLEQRWVISQKFNLETPDIERLFLLLEENLKPENITYSYDFYYDNCSTRIRDLMEKAVGEDLLYPPEKTKKELQTFRYLTGEYEKVYPWLKLGIDLLIGSPGDKKASFREMMFLPAHLKNGLSELLIRRNSKMIPLLQDPEIVLDIDQQPLKEKLFTSPLFVFSLLLIIIIILTASVRRKTVNNIIDIFLFSVFSILALLMIFFNFFTDHHQLRWNLNIIWLNPFIILCLTSLVFKKDWPGWFGIVFYLAVLFLLFLAVLPQHINNAFFPLIIILMIRSSIRAGFSWNPLTLPYLTQL